MIDKLKNKFKDIVDSSKNIEEEMKQMVDSEMFPDNATVLFISQKSVLCDSEDQDVLDKIYDFLVGVHNFYEKREINSEQEKVDTSGAVLRFENLEGEIEETDKFEVSKRQVVMGESRVKEICYLVDKKRTIVSQGNKMKEIKVDGKSDDSDEEEKPEV